MKKGKLVSIAGLFFFLILLPAGTYLFLRSGFEYRRESLSDLENLALIDTTGIRDLVSPAEIDFDKSLFVFGELGNINIAQANKIYNQFKNRDDVYHIYTFSEELAGRDTFGLLNTSREQVKIVEDPERFIGNDFAENIRTGFLLADYTGYVRKVYRYDSNEELGLLIEHIAMKLKSGERKKIMFQREVEK